MQFLDWEVFVPIVIVSAFWGTIGIFIPFFIPLGINRGLTQCCIILTSVTCWLFWILSYLCQLHPLYGPKLDNHNLLVFGKEWNDGFDIDPIYYKK